MKLVGFACGVFDLFHAGHVMMLKECREHCDYLVVALNEAEHLSPDKSKPILSLSERSLLVSSCRYVDEVITYSNEVELLALLKSGRFGIRFLGDDYQTKPITGADLTLPIYYIDRSHGLSTTNLLKRIRQIP